LSIKNRSGRIQVNTKYPGKQFLNFPGKRNAGFAAVIDCFNNRNGETDNILEAIWIDIINDMYIKFVPQIACLDACNNCEKR
jgi:hypothetical protein